MVAADVGLTIDVDSTDYIERCQTEPFCLAITDYDMPSKSFDDYRMHAWMNTAVVRWWMVCGLLRKQCSEYADTGTQASHQKGLVI